MQVLIVSRQFLHDVAVKLFLLHKVVLDSGFLRCGKNRLVIDRTLAQDG